jgi:hypothetical protein
MKQKPSSRRRRSSTKSVLRLPHLEHAKAAVLNSLNSADAKAIGSGGGGNIGRDRLGSIKILRLQVPIRSMSAMASRVESRRSGY